MLSHAEGVVATVEGNELRLEEDITIDGEVGVATGLDTAEASCEEQVRKRRLLYRM